MRVQRFGSEDEVRPALAGGRAGSPRAVGAAGGAGVDAAVSQAADDGVAESGWRRALWTQMQAPPFQVVSMVATFYALLIPDICYGFLPASSDVALLSVGLSIVFFFFILEGLATVVGRPRSVFSMFFYLDVVATLSLIAVRGPSRRPTQRLQRSPLTVRSAVAAHRTSCGFRRRWPGSRRRSSRSPARPGSPASGRGRRASPGWLACCA